jgi:hypothetical protein
MKYSLHGESKVRQIVHNPTQYILGLTGYLKSSSPIMYRIYLVMKERPPDEITPDVIAIASGKVVLDLAAMMQWLGKYESTSSTIQSAFQRQVDAAAGPWEQDKFEDMLTKWVVATDQPFYTVDEAEFRDLLIYTHHPSPNLKIPHRDAIKRRIMRMGEDAITATREMFRVRHL